jgi:hypothetical protein
MYRAGLAYGWLASSTTMKAYMMGSAINAPNNALNISSFVMLKFKTFIRGTCRAEHLVCGKQYNGFWRGKLYNYIWHSIEHKSNRNGERTPLRANYIQFLCHTLTVYKFVHFQFSLVVAHSLAPWLVGGLLN